MNTPERNAVEVAIERAREIVANDMSEDESEYLARAVLQLAEQRDALRREAGSVPTTPHLPTDPIELARYTLSKYPDEPDKPSVRLARAVINMTTLLVDTRAALREACDIYDGLGSEESNVEEMAAKDARIAQLRAIADGGE